MTKTVDERLYDQIMRTPHAIRRAMIGEHFCPHFEGQGPANDKPVRVAHPMRGPRPHHRMHGGPGTAFAQERMLDVISRFEGGVRQKELTEELKIRPSSVSETISKLEHDGYVKRKVDPDDKRATLITLTEVGEARAAELSDERQGKLSKAFEPLTDEEKEQLILLLKKLSERE